MVGRTAKEAPTGCLPSVPRSRAAAQAHSAAAEARLRATPPRWYRDRRVQLAALVGVTSLLCYQVNRRAWPTPLGGGALSNAVAEQRALGHCDRFDARVWEVVDGANVKQRVRFCWFTAGALPVVYDGENDDDGDLSLLRGELRKLPPLDSPKAPWVAAMRRDVELTARAYPVYLRQDGDIDRRFAILALTSMAVGAITGWVLWIRAGWRRRRAA